MVFNVIFINISAISWLKSALGQILASRTDVTESWLGACIHINRCISERHIHSKEKTSQRRMRNERVFLIY